MCEIYRIPHSTFLQWDPDDRHKAVMHQIRKSERCPSCGTHPDEWDPKAGGSRGAYVAKFHTCWGCKTKADGEAELERARENKNVRVPEGTTVRLQRPPAEDEEAGRG